jgi:perosamine synthetase
MTALYDEIIEFIRTQFNTPDEFIPLHVPRFIGNEKKYVLETIDSTFVSSVGAYVDKFEEDIADFIGSKHAIAVSNGTSALHVALKMAGVDSGDEVITQPLTFVATANAITYANAHPVFVDVDRDTMGLSPDKLKAFLEKNAEIKSDGSYNKETGRRFSACVPMHTFGFPCRIDEIVSICENFKIPVVEDAAESLGSSYKGKHTGTFGKLGIFSFNGNKTITAGGGGAVVTDDEELAKRTKHITTTAKVPHKWEYIHDKIGYNYRMPNLNAALACAQLEQLKSYIKNKRALANDYANFFKDKAIDFIEEPDNSISNYWLMALLLNDKKQQQDFLAYTNDREIMTRPIWRLMPKLEMYKNSQTANLDNAYWLEKRIVNIPSSVIIDG